MLDGTIFFSFYFWVLLVILVSVILVGRSALIVPQGKVVIVEELGRFKLECGPGIHFLNPMTERPKCVNWKYEVETPVNGKTTVVQMTKTDCYISTVPTIFDPPAVTVTTKDKVTVKVNVVVFYKVIAVQFAVYEIDDLYQALQQMINTSLRSSVSRLTLDELIGESKNSIAQDIFERTSRQDWGIKVLQVEIQSITAPPDITKATEEMVRSKRESESKIQAEMVSRETKLFLMDTEAQLQIAEVKHNRSKLELQHRHRLDIQKSEGEINRLRFEQECAHKLIQARHDLELQQIEITRSKLETEAEIHYYTNLLNINGINQDLIIHKLQAKSFNNIIKHNKSIIVPYDAVRYLGTKQILQNIPTLFNNDNSNNNNNNNNNSNGDFILA